MVNPRRRRPIRNRRRNNRIHSQIAQIASSKAIVKRNRGNNDPPVIPTTIHMTRRIRYICVYERSNTPSTGVAVINPSSTTATGLIRRYVPYNDAELNSTGGFSVDFTLGEIANAARNYLFGSGAPASNVEFALHKVEFFGGFGGQISSVSLRCDFSYDMGGAIANDSPGGRDRRAYVGLRSPRLSWFTPTNDGQAVRLVIYGVNPSGFITGDTTQYTLGFLDFVVEGVQGPTVITSPTLKTHIQDME